MTQQHNMRIADHDIVLYIVGEEQTYIMQPCIDIESNRKDTSSLTTWSIFYRFTITQGCTTLFLRAPLVLAWSSLPAAATWYSICSICGEISSGIGRFGSLPLELLTQAHHR